MEDFVSYIVKNLVEKPEAVEVRSINGGDNVKLEIRVSQEDVGKVIGRKGTTIHALRTIIRRVSARLSKKVEIDLIQPEIKPEESSIEAEEQLAMEGCCMSSPNSGCCSEEAIEEVHHCGCHSGGCNG